MIGVVSGKIHEHADSPHLLALLRERRRGPGSHRAAEERNKFAASKVSAHLPLPCEESLNQGYRRRGLRLQAAFVIELFAARAKVRSAARPVTVLLLKWLADLLNGEAFHVLATDELLNGRHVSHL